MPRHQTLTATMDWSYDLLPTAEQVALRRLAVFPGSFDLEAAEAVVGQQEDSASSVELEVLDLLSHLVDKSLVVVDSEGVNVRYRLLETVREYGSAKLAEAGEPDWVRRRHRDFFLALASTHEDPVEPTRKWSSGEWIRQVHADQDSFRTALEWSIAEGTTRRPCNWLPPCGGTGGGHGRWRAPTGWSGCLPSQRARSAPSGWRRSSARGSCFPGPAGPRCSGGRRCSGTPSASPWRREWPRKRLGPATSSASWPSPAEARKRRSPC